MGNTEQNPFPKNIKEDIRKNGLWAACKKVEQMVDFIRLKAEGERRKLENKN